MGNTVNVREIIAETREAAHEEAAAQLQQRFGGDPRRGVQDALLRMHKRLEAIDAERIRTEALYAEIRAAGRGAVVVGIDEVGRGAIAGPLTVAAVVLPLEPLIFGLNDSKKLSPARREELSADIRTQACAIGIAHVPPDAIDKHGMSACLRAAMRRALENTNLTPDLVLIDGNPVHIHVRERCIVKGDGKVACIAAASIIAKTTRDHIMIDAHARYPGYGFAESKGYGSAAHIEAVKHQGLTEFHRASFCTGFFQDTLF